MNKVERFRELHASGCFVMPNPWDRGSAAVLAQLGFPALATTSSGFAWSIGKQDNGITLDDALEHFRVMSAAVEVPLNGDFEGGFAVDPDAVARNYAAVAKTGLAGVSIEDADHGKLLDFALSVERVRAARSIDIVLTARCEAYLVNDVPEVIRRLTAYADAGADCLFAPGIRDIEVVRTIVREVAPKPVNVLVASDFTTVAEMRDAGVRRISVGGALARAAWTGFLTAAREIAEQGTFTNLARAISGADLNAKFL